MLWPPYVLLSTATPHYIATTLIERINHLYDLNNKGKIQYTHIQEVITSFSFLHIHISIWHYRCSSWKMCWALSCSVYLLVMNSLSFCGKQKAPLFLKCFGVVWALEKCIAPCFLNIDDCSTIFSLTLFLIRSSLTFVTVAFYLVWLIPSLVAFKMFPSLPVLSKC